MRKISSVPYKAVKEVSTYKALKIKSSSIDVMMIFIDLPFFLAYIHCMFPMKLKHCKI